MRQVLPELPHMGRHALAAVVELAGLEGDARLTSGALALRTGAPRPVLAKVLRALAAAGILQGARGHGGGYRLARPPHAIPLVDVLAAATGRSPGDLQPECALGVRACDPTQPCALHHTWVKVIDAGWRVLVEHTVADVVPTGRVVPPGS